MNTAILEQDIWTVQEVAAWLRVDKKTIYRAIADGRLPVLRLGASRRTLRCVKADVLALREGKTP
jgi:excisionase family DNA binding protein